eukprot:COSAG02_NODE_498_length_21087_cov_33.272394_17_plen_43_part_00
MPSQSPLLFLFTDGCKDVDTENAVVHHWLTHVVPVMQMSKVL